MPRTKPSYVPAATTAGAPIDFKWNKRVSAKIFSEEVHDRLFDAVKRTTYKASYALGIAAAEWTVYRFSSRTDVSDPLNRIEAAWASAIEPATCRGLRFRLTEKTDDPKNLVNGPLDISLALLYSMHHRYSQNNLDMPLAVCRQISLAQLVLPKSVNFETWLSQNLRKLADTFPQQGEPNAKTYDWRHEEIVPREFFDDAFVYTKESAAAALQAFVATLDPAQNPYLRTAEEMKASGFTGTPYSLSARN